MAPIITVGHLVKRTDIYRIAIYVQIAKFETKLSELTEVA